MSETIFDKIIRREIKADIVFESDEVLGFRDIEPEEGSCPIGPRQAPWVDLILSQHIVKSQVVHAKEIDERHSGQGGQEVDSNESEDRPAAALDRRIEPRVQRLRCHADHESRDDEAVDIACGRGQKVGRTTAASEDR